MFPAALCAEVEERLVSQLLSPERYNKLIRPAVNNSQQVAVYIQVSLAQLINVVRKQIQIRFVIYRRKWYYMIQEHCHCVSEREGADHDHQLLALAGLCPHCSSCP